MTRIGLLGGSFNPAHRGHRRISLAAIEALGLDEIWWLVSPGNPLKPAKRHGAARRAARLGPARWRAARRSGSTAIERELGTRLHRRYARRAGPPLPRTPLHLADGRRQSRPVPPLARLAEDRARWFRLRWSPVRAMMRGALAAPAMGWLRRFVRPAARRGTGRRGDRRRSCCCACRPIRPPQPPSAPPIPTGTNRHRNRSPPGLPRRRDAAAADLRRSICPQTPSAPHDRRSHRAAEALHELVLRSLDDDQAVDDRLHPARGQIAASPTIW